MCSLFNCLAGIALFAGGLYTKKGRASMEEGEILQMASSEVFYAKFHIIHSNIAMRVVYFYLSDKSGAGCGIKDLFCV